LLAVDLDGTGNLDLVVSSGENVSVLPGNGKGDFGAAINFTAGGGPSALLTGSYSHDPLPDLAVVEYWANTVGVLLNSCGH
jgi:hypothetical protein